MAAAGRVDLGLAAGHVERDHVAAGGRVGIVIVVEVEDPYLPGRIDGHRWVSVNRGIAEEIGGGVDRVGNGTGGPLRRVTPVSTVAAAAGLVPAVARRGAGEGQVVEEELV